MRGKSIENWDAGCICLDHGKNNAAASRFYYSVFQAVLWWAERKQAYTYTRGESHIHGDMMVKMNQDATASRADKYLFREFQLLRQTADYQADTPTRAQIEALLYEGQFLRERYLKKAVE